MTELSIDLWWTRETPELAVESYNTSHEISLGGDDKIHADAAPGWGGNPTATNPEQTLAASISSCHMMTFLSLAARAKWPVAAYFDHAVAELGRNPAGRMAVTEIRLAPRVTFDTGFDVTASDIEKMHYKAHKLCFVANSVLAVIKIEPTI
jgi:organic hydroperoxide reductase OsmC/OhrA